MKVWTLSPEMSPEDFSAFKQEMLAYAISRDACQEGLDAHNMAKTPQEWVDKCAKYLYWLKQCAPKLEGFIHIGGSVELTGYPHALSSLQSIGGDADVINYGHALPSLRSIGGDAYLVGHGHALPSLQLIGGDADLIDYGHALPSLRSIGGDAYLARYGHALPTGCVVNGNIYR